MQSELDLNKCLYEQLQTADDELLDVSDGDFGSIQSFLDRLADVQRMATRAIAQNSLTTATASLIRSVASTGAALARLASRTQDAAADVEKRTQPEIEVVMEKLSLDNAPREDEIRYEARSETDQSHLPTHVLRCYDWLLKNLHNPYPPSSFRSKVSKDTGVSQKAICDWFTNARRKIGWTRISEQHFRKDRALTVDCARVVLLGEKSKVPVRAELRDAFLAMKETVERLFEDVLGPSEVAKHLDDLVTKHTSTSGRINLVNSKASPKPSCQQTKEAKSRSSSQKVLGKRRAAPDETSPATAPESSSEHPRGKRLRTIPRNSDPSSSTVSLETMRPSVAAEISCSSSKRRRAESEENRPAKRRHHGLSGSKDLSLNETSPEYGDGRPASPSGSLDNSYDVTSDSTTPSPSTSLLTISDELIATPSPSASEDLLAATSPNADPRSNDIFSIKDLVDLPDMPTFTWDGADILPPSFEPIPLSADFSITQFSSLIDSDQSWLSALEAGLYSGSKSDASLPDLTSVQEPGSETAPFPDFFRDFFLGDDCPQFEEMERKEREL